MRQVSRYPKTCLKTAVLVGALSLAVLLPTGAVAQAVQGAFAGNDPGLSAIDVYYHVGPIQVGKTEDMTASEVSVSFIDVPSGVSITASIAEASSSSVAEAFYAEAFSFSSDTNFVQIVNGLRDPSGFAANPDGRSINIAVHQLDDIRRFAKNPDSIDVIFYHGSTDAPAVDLVGRDGTVYATGLSYGDRSLQYKAIKAGETVTIDVLRSADAQVMGSYVAAVPSGHAGRAGFVMLRGFVNPSANAGGAALRLTMVPASGSAYDFSEESTVAAERVGEHPPMVVGSVYPNPVDQASAVALLRVNAPGPATLQVYDMLGRLVRGGITATNAGSSRFTIPVQSLAPGSYFVVVTTDAGRVSRRMIVTR